jgi:ElaA protein
MKECMNFIQKQYGKVAVRISAQCYLTRFYEGFGFHTVGEEYEEDHIPHIEMLRD